MKTLKFSNGDTMPALGLGTWKSEPGEVYNAVLEAIKVGFRHIDCAMIYGNEAEIGKALKEALDGGLVKREELWITSKLWNNSHRREQVIPALKATLKDLQLDYLDLYLIHWPVAFPENVIYPEKGEELANINDYPIAETWKGMEDAHYAGLAKHIGVSNFSTKKLGDLTAVCNVKPEMNQIEMHPLLQQPKMLAYCKEAGIHLTAYSPLGSIDRSPQMKAENEPNLFENEVIVEVSKSHDCSPAQVLIAWAMQRGTAVIPKSVNAGRIKQNFASADILLTKDEMTKIAKLDRHYRYVKGDFWARPGSPYTVSWLWDE